MQAHLEHDAAGPEQFPIDGLPEVAVMGRSNVGKSSLINALLARRNLARTSGTPGKTRRVHFFRVDDRAYVVDLPGYGYAAVAKTERAAWRPLVEAYLRRNRVTLKGALLLMDARRGPQAEERELLEWLDVQNVPARIVFTKADKLKSKDLGAARKASQAELEWPQDRIAFASTKTGKGLGTVAAWIDEWTGVALRRADGQPFAR